MEPQSRIGVAQLTRMAFDGVDLQHLRSHLLTQCVLGADCAGALMDLSVIDQLHGYQDQGLDWQSRAFETCRVFQTWQGKRANKKLLVFAAPIHMGGNTPVEFLLRNADFEVVTYYLDPGASPETTRPLPDHDVAFCAVPADTEQTAGFFDQVRALTKPAGRPTLNLPTDLVQLNRDTLDRTFRDVDGLRVPPTQRITRQSLATALQAGAEDACLAGLGGYPYVIRPVGSHAGLGLSKVCTRAELAAYLATRADPEYYVSAFINYASPQDGQFRKYRIVFVDGVPFPVHMAISDQWDVWYMNANMKDCPDKRREEAAFMADFATDFAPRHRQGFDALVAGIGLDYFGVDCAEDPDGNLVVFEADNALIVHDMDCQTVFPYKARHMGDIFTAFQDMLRNRGSQGADTAVADLPIRAAPVPHVFA